MSLEFSISFKKDLASSRWLTVSSVCIACSWRRVSIASVSVQACTVGVFNGCWTGFGREYFVSVPVNSLILSLWLDEEVLKDAVLLYETFALVLQIENYAYLFFDGLFQIHNNCCVGL
jgi:hypothetical protein